MNPPVIAQVRDLIPIRRLTKSEALRLAELQATKFLALTGVTEPHVPESRISELPRVQVERMSPWPTSGATVWSNGRWLIVLNGAEPTVRQRFSLAHEFKHILDHRFIHILYTGVPEHEREAFTEQVCDYFAGCLLMPRPWLKRAWTTQTQRLDELARMFHVSQAAMNTRLHQVGLIEATPRCAPQRKDWAIEALRATGEPGRYHRTATPAFQAAEVAA